MRGSIRVVGIVVVLAAAAGGVRMGAQQNVPDGLRLVRTRPSFLGMHRWYQQTYRGVDVLTGVVARHDFDAGETVTHDRRRTLARDIGISPAIAAADAAAAAGRYVVRTTLAIRPGDDPRLVWSVIAEPPVGTTRTLVDAQTGVVLLAERIARDVDGTGRVFNPNPVVTLRDYSLRDQDDADYAALASAYFVVPLTHLDGSGFLRGDFARIDFDDAATAFSPSNTFLFDRSSMFFSQAIGSVGTAQATRIEADFTGTDCQLATFSGRVVLTKQ